MTIRAIQARIGLPLKFMLSMSILIALTSVTLGWFITQHEIELIRVALMDRGKSLVRNLAYNLGYELQFAAEQRLNELLEGVIKQEDVLYAVIRDVAGDIRAQAQAEQVSEIPPMSVPRSEFHAPKWPESATRVYVVKWGREQIYEIVQPITTQVRREREEIGLSLGGQEQTIGWANIGMSLQLKQVNETIVAIQRSIALLTLGVIVVGVAVTAVLVKVIVRPITQLADATRQIAAGDLSFNVEVSSKDELGELAGSFNRMAQALRDRERDNARLFRELEDTNRQLEAASRHKSQFLANMSHELRTPLNSIIGFSEILLDESWGELSAAERREFLSNILSSGRHLLRLINDILDLSKIEAGRVELRPERFSVAAVIEDVLATVRPLASKKQMTLDVEIDPTLTALVADTGKVKQILYNLLSNAIKFTPDEGRTGLRALRDAQEARFAVWDTGIGITPQDQTRIFEEFQQVETTTARQYEGTGLGLALAKKFVELQGGRIWVESEAGRGSTFTFTLPLPESASALGAAPSGPEPLDRPLVLIVEDDAKTRELLRFCLSREGFRIEEASDGEEAMRKAQALYPALVTLDVVLPKKDGWEVLRELKEDPCTRDIPVIIVSIVDEPAQGFSLGASEYLLKPLDRDDFLNRLRRYSFPSNRASTPVQILIIDDDPLAVETLAGMLESEGFSVSKAYGGRQGLELAMARPPDLIVVDLLMPDVSGFEVVQRLKEHPQTKETPVFIVTVKDLTSQDKQRLNNLASAVMRKGAFARDEFLQEVAKLIRLKAAQEGRLPHGR
jgi:signal transduction histidine kinase/CheY-like chemotaxis protein